MSRMRENDRAPRAIPTLAPIERPLLYFEEEADAGVVVDVGALVAASADVPSAELICVTVVVKLNVVLMDVDNAAEAVVVVSVCEFRNVMKLGIRLTTSRASPGSGMVGLRLNLS